MDMYNAMGFGLILCAFFGGLAWCALQMVNNPPTPAIPRGESEGAEGARLTPAAKEDFDALDAPPVVLRDPDIATSKEFRGLVCAYDDMYVKASQDVAADQDRAQTVCAHAIQRHRRYVDTQRRARMDMSGIDAPTLDADAIEARRLLEGGM